MKKNKPLLSLSLRNRDVEKDTTILGSTGSVCGTDHHSKLSPSTIVQLGDKYAINTLLNHIRTSTPTGQF